MSAKNTTENASGTLLTSLSVIADNTSVTETGAVLEPFSISVPDGNTAVNDAGTLPSTLPVIAESAKACQIVKVALPNSLPATVDYSGRLVVANDAMTVVKSIKSSEKTMIDSVSALPSKTLLSTGKSTSNAVGVCALPQGVHTFHSS